ncbi:hypothetical protein ACFFGR_15930 [Arthrobacter liuii]|uniref:Uncharacterized protein n=1 Tax=Arthrobacter liuii TaxID=1476996 RepID=A0ABQ2ASX7_9MICC|nr:hypothetical protein [Arthrobacter liuii]GGH95638.1 hypothetical protein GCM10007170_21630 [Arthrobacter liuii]
MPQAADAVRAPMAKPEGETADAATASARPVNRIPHGNGLACDSRTKPAAGTPLPAGAGPQDAPTGGPSDALPGTPGAATGGSSPSGGNGSATPARLGAYNLQIPGGGIAAVQGGPPAAPAPVSSDPGSSPD